MQAGFRFGEFVGQRGGNTVARHIQRGAVELVGVADNKGHRHGFAQRAAQSEHHAADHAVFGKRQHDTPDHFPGGTADAVGRLFHHHRRLLKHITHYRGNVRNDHDGEDDARGQDTDTERRAGEQRANERNIGEHIAHRLLEISGEQRGEDKQAPHAVNDTRDSRQQFNRNTQRALQPVGGQLGQEQGDTKAHRHRNQQGDKRGHQGSVDRH